MSEALVLRETPEAGVALLTFNRPDKLNALSTPLLEQWKAHMQAIERDESVRVVILTGAGPKAFVAGADIAEYADHNPSAFIQYQLDSRQLFQYVERFPKPVVGAINGYALGGGFEIALCCDVLVASSNARFGLPEGLLGLSPGGGGTQRLTRAVGRYLAADMLLAARRITADRAFQLGLVVEVVEPEQLLATAVEKARQMMKVAPLAAREMKRLLRESQDAALDTGLSLEQEILFRLYNSADAAEGIRAFMEKRDPNFTGR